MGQQARLDRWVSAAHLGRPVRRVSRERLVLRVCLGLRERRVLPARLDLWGRQEQALQARRAPRALRGRLGRLGPLEALQGPPVRPGLLALPGTMEPPVRPGRPGRLARREQPG